MYSTPPKISPSDEPLRRRSRAWLGGLVGVCVLGAGACMGALAAGAHTPAVLRAQPAVSKDAAVTLTSLTQEMGARLAAPDCQSMRLDTASLLALQQLLHPLGLGMRVLGCPMAPAPLQQRVLAVTAVVLDGEKATDTVRGALGDGEPVDMGSEYRPSPWPVRGNAAETQAQDDAEVSPDVMFNRRWLRSVMASQGYASVTGPWWAFIRVPSRKK